MRKIINKKNYDTKKAEFIAFISRGEGFAEKKETLYRSKRGIFFIESGAFRNRGQGLKDYEIAWCKNIIPLNESEAYQWLERAGETEAINKYFKNEIEES